VRIACVACAACAGCAGAAARPPETSRPAIASPIARDAAVDAPAVDTDQQALVDRLTGELPRPPDHRHFVVVHDLEVSGDSALDAGKVRYVLDDASGGSLRTCFAAEPRTCDVAVRGVIGRGGRAIAVEVDGASDALTACIVAAIGAAEFPASGEPAVTRFSAEIHAVVLDR